ncbi:CRP-like cAMP-binding protein [Moryella indoligenes]|uniref:CRP-like cAMP-binding protein n=1 Tax=Moryella indoligenes TaxID=371674 RepID=A0AAE3VCE2_9FIRM|nr:Crp/Fnr family transcriptional regulator [Moryella indoligenes]MDQ0153694.1 CRP-like cAMP-binding protein [Moryella indoligenes]
MLIEYELNKIKKSFLFKNTSENEIRQFVKNYHCSIVKFDRNDCIITREEISKRIGIVLSGTVGIYSDSFYGGHTLIGLGGQHYLFGFIAIFYNKHNSITTLYSHDNCTVAFFDIPSSLNSVEFIRSTPPQILSNIYEMLTIHIRDDFDRQQIISSKSVKVKLARYMIYSSKYAGSMQFDIKMNRTELSNFLGTYRTTLSRELSRMEREGLIRTERSLITILDYRKLLDIEMMSY